MAEYGHGSVTGLNKTSGRGRAGMARNWEIDQFFHPIKLERRQLDNYYNLRGGVEFCLT